MMFEGFYVHLLYNMVIEYILNKMFDVMRNVCFGNDFHGNYFMEKFKRFDFGIFEFWKGFL